MNVGIFGITANPPHIGHIKVILEAAKQLDEVWVTPVFYHPFKKKMVSYKDRVKMLSLLLIEMDIKNIYIKELDKEYFEKMNEMVYSYNLLNYLKEKYQDINFKLILGEDNKKKEVWERFFKFKELEKEFELIIIKDMGNHSTDIRGMLANNISIEPLVGKSVAKYINENKLFKEF
jgi:nicotinate-nucleotide adenylyltransferase